MNPVDRVLSGFRKLVTMEDKLAKVEQATERLDSAVDDIDRRLVRLETVVQMASGKPLPPLTPRLPR